MAYRVAQGRRTLGSLGIWSIVLAATLAGYYLEAGDHLLIIKQREDGTKLDQILITGDMYFIPQ